MNRSIVIVACAVLMMSSCKNKEGDGLFLIQKDKQYGYIDRTGVIVIAPRNEWIVSDDLPDSWQRREFSDGLAAIRSGTDPLGNDWHWGYIDETGKEIIKPQYIVAGVFSEGVAVVSPAYELTCFVDKQGNVIFETHEYGIRGVFSEGLIPMMSTPIMNANTKVGYMDRTGRIIIAPQFRIAESFSEGMAAVTYDVKWGFIDKLGKVVIEPQYAKAFSFSEGLALVKIGSKWGFINKSGELAITPKYEMTHPDRELFLSNDGSLGFSEGLAAVFMNGKYGYIDKSGTLVVPRQFASANRFSEGLAVVCVVEGKHQYGYIDKTGELAIKPQFDWASSFHNGLALVKVDEQLGYIDRAGKYVWRKD